LNKEIGGGMKSILKVLAILFAVAWLAACSTAPSLSSNRADAINLCKEAYDVYWGRDWNRVDKLSTKAIASDPAFAWPYSLRGVARTHEGRYAQAVEDLDRAIELAPGYQPAYTNRAIANMKMKQYDMAERDLDRAMRMDRADVISPVIMAEVHALQQDVPQACRYLNEAVSRGLRNIEVIEQRKGFASILQEDCYLDLLDAVRQQADAAAGR
jgi:tetratricopeptide (TPR) repeat protein